MNLRRKNRLLVVGAVLCGISLAAGLMLYALSASIDLFYTPEEIHFGKRETGQRPVPGQRLRVGGMVKAGSVKRSTQSLAIAFTLYDARSEITVRYTGILPDLFREEQGVVVQGELLPGNVVLAKEVLAKHDENYTPPEVNRAMQDHHQRAGEEAL